MSNQAELMKKQSQILLGMGKAIEALEEKVEGLTLKEGPQGAQGPRGEPGRSANAEAVAAELMSKHADLLRAPDIDIAELAAHLVAKHAHALRGEAGIPGIPGLDGKDAEPVSALEVATIIKEKFGELLRGKDGAQGPAGADGKDGAQGPAGPAGADGKDGLPGANGKDADPEAVAEILATKHADALRGEVGPAGEMGPAGQDADPEAVAEILATKHADALRGEQGAPGPRGDVGPAGADADVIDVANLIHEKYGDLLRGKDGRDGVDGKSVELKEVITELVGKHADVLRGAAGRDGITSIVTDTEIKAWLPEAHYFEGALVTHHLGRKYAAVRDTNDEPGDSPDWERIGTEGFRWRDDHKGVEEGDMFMKDYSLWAVLAGAERLIVGRPKVDHSKLARELIEADEVREHVERVIQKRASSEPMRKELGDMLRDAVRVETDTHGRKFIILNGEAHALAGDYDAMQSELSAVKSELAAAHELMRKMAVRMEVLEARTAGSHGG